MMDVNLSIHQWASHPFPSQCLNWLVYQSTVILKLIASDKSDKTTALLDPKVKALHYVTGFRVAGEDHTQNKPQRRASASGADAENPQVFSRSGETTAGNSEDAGRSICCNL